MKKYKFTADIYTGDGGGAYILFPYDVEKEFGTKGKVPVKVVFDGVPYRTSLFKYGLPQHMIGTPKAIRDKIGKGPGDKVSVELWRDQEDRVVDVPEDLQKLMKKEGLLPFFEKLSYTHRKEYCRWIAEARKEETRLRRLEKAKDMMKGGIKT